MGKFQELKVWQKGKDLAVYLYKLTMKGAFFKDYGLRDQIRKNKHLLGSDPVLPNTT